jgi:bacterioferritin-associated ferredoxin
MDLDEELCLCFHVTQRKVVNFLRIERPKRASQLADCQGAGTGCGWCRPFLERLFDASQKVASPDDAAASAALPSSMAYARQRGRYIEAGGGKPPPGATPPPAAEVEPPTVDDPPGNP